MSIAAVQAGIRRRSASFVEDFKARGRGHSGGGYAGGTTPGLVAEGISRQRALMNHQAEQYRHFQGHVYAIVRTIANRVGAQHLRVGRKMPTAEAPTYRRRSRRIVGLNQKIYLKRRRKYDPVRRERSLRARLGMTWKDFVPKSFSDHTSKSHLLERHPLLQAFENPNPIMVKSTMMFVTVASLEREGAGMRKLAHVLASLLPNLPLSNGLKVDHLSHDASVIAAYRNDPLVFGKITPRLADFIFRAGEASIADAAKLSVPTLLLVAGADKLVDPSGSTAFATAASSTGQLTTRHFAALYHELMNEAEPARTQVMKQMGDWLDRLPD